MRVSPFGQSTEGTVITDVLGFILILPLDSVVALSVKGVTGLATAKVNSIKQHTTTNNNFDISIVSDVFFNFSTLKICKNSYSSMR